jgi:hypothetical protein
MNPETQPNPDYQNVRLSRRAAELRALSWKFNIFQLAKRVRRAKRHGEAFVKVIAANKGFQDRDKRNRHALAVFGLRRCEAMLRIGVYYLANHNVPTEGVEASLRELQAA